MIEINNFGPAIVPHRYGEEELAKLVGRCIDAIDTLNAAVRELQDKVGQLWDIKENELKKREAELNERMERMDRREKYYTIADIKGLYREFIEWRSTQPRLPQPDFLNWLEKL